ncbi:MAG: tRNA 2-thiouridine(34) synthase MnmA [bacterium]|nr:MAG: tRNA 2-thiouridine(34) synthase MnmA [bacterium]
MNNLNQDRKDGIAVAVAMSGGVDSSVAAALLKQKGYDVIGLTMQVWDYESVGGNIFNESSCCSLESMYDARAVCHTLAIPHYVIDVRDEFERYVIANFETEYLNGRTPNPCILCNSKIKWEILLKKAIELGCDYFATGHYARVTFDEGIGRYILQRGLDRSKDQAYALWGLSQQQLKRTIFPLGDLSKAEVRKIANNLNLKTKDKQESQEICFVVDNDYSRFLRERNPELLSEIGYGEILDKQGNVLGHHKGYPFYTIGQRKGLGVAVGTPMYVTEIDAEANKIIMGEKEDLKEQSLLANHVNWIAIEKLTSLLEVEAQIRYNDPGRKATVYPADNGYVKVMFAEFHQAVTPGQSVVFFKNDIVVGGGVIERWNPKK